MTFEEATREAAIEADKAVYKAMTKYKRGDVTDEDDLTGVLIGQLDAAMEGTIGGLSWKSRILRHRRGEAAEEKKVGADLLIHIDFETPTQSYSKGVLVQAKRLASKERMTPAAHAALIDQCSSMLSFSPAAFVFSYAPGSMRCGAATKIAGSVRTDIYDVCGWTSYRFFLEFFRCPIGDINITSTAPDFLPVPNILSLQARGELSDEETGTLVFR